MDYYRGLSILPGMIAMQEAVTSPEAYRALSQTFQLRLVQTSNQTAGAEILYLVKARAYTRSLETQVILGPDLNACFF
jgi:hypothetical protein